MQICQDPGSKLTLGSPLPPLGFSLPICKMGMIESDYVTLKPEESLPGPPPHVTQPSGFLGHPPLDYPNTPPHSQLPSVTQGSPHPCSPPRIPAGLGGGTGWGSHRLSPWDSSPLLLLFTPCPSLVNTSSSRNCLWKFLEVTWGSPGPPGGRAVLPEFESQTSVRGHVPRPLSPGSSCPPT